MKRRQQMKSGKCDVVCLRNYRFIYFFPRFFSLSSLFYLFIFSFDYNIKKKSENVGVRQQVKYGSFLLQVNFFSSKIAQQESFSLRPVCLRFFFSLFLLLRSLLLKIIKKEKIANQIHH